MAAVRLALYMLHGNLYMNIIICIEVWGCCPIVLFKNCRCHALDSLLAAKMVVLVNFLSK